MNKTYKGGSRPAMWKERPQEIPDQEADIIELKHEGLNSVQVSKRLKIPLSVVNRVFSEPYAQ